MVHLPKFLHIGTNRHPKRSAEEIVVDNFKNSSLQEMFNASLQVAKAKDQVIKAKDQAIGALGKAIELYDELEEAGLQAPARSPIPAQENVNYAELIAETVGEWEGIPGGARGKRAVKGFIKGKANDINLLVGGLVDEKAEKMLTDAGVKLDKEITT